MFTNHFIIMVVQNWVSGFNVLLGVCVSGLVSKFAKGDEQGFALGTLAAVQSIVSVLGPAIFGGLYGWAAPQGGVIIGPHLVRSLPAQTIFTPLREQLPAIALIGASMCERGAGVYGCSCLDCAIASGGHLLSLPGGGGVRAQAERGGRSC